MNYKIIQLPKSDWHRYREIRLEGLQSDPQAFGSKYEDEAKFPEEKWVSRLQPYSDEYKQWRVFTIDEKDKIVGTAGAYVMEENGVPLVVGVFVSENHRNKGLGRLMIEQIIKEIKATGQYPTVHIMVNEKQLAAVSLYKKLGFKEIGEEFYEMGDGITHRELLMEKQI